MSKQHPSTDLTDAERACLEYLLQHPDVELIQFDSMVVEHLVNRGFVDRVLLMAFPIMTRQVRYRLTAKGRAVADDSQARLDNGH